MSRKALSTAIAGALLLPAAFLPTSASGSACAGVLCAGSARSDITPPVTTPMWGYSARANYSQPDRWLAQHTREIDTDGYEKSFFLRSEGIHTRLYARALLLRNAAGVEMALVQVDLGAMTGEMWTAVAKRVAPLGIARERLLISATHTHGGPGAIQQAPAHGLLVGGVYDPRVVKRVADGIVKAISLAHARLAPSRVAIGQGSLLGASVNRSYDPHLGNPCPDPAAVPEGIACDHAAPDAESSTDPHAIEPKVTMIRADRTDGVPLGVWTSFAAHGTVFGDQNLLFSADNQGFAERLVEQGIASRAAAAGIGLPEGHQIVAAYANGTEGDIAPRCSGYNDFACAEQTGALQAEQVLALYDSLGSSLASDIELDARLDVLYMDGSGGTSPIPILGAGPDCPFGRPPFDTYPGNDPIPGQGRKCPFIVLAGTGPQWFWLQALRIGDYVLADAPGELTVQFGRRLRQRILSSPANTNASGPVATHAVVVGLANDYMAYITTPEEYDFQWYEGTFTLWGRNEGPYFIDRMGALTDALLSGAPGPFFVEPPDTSGTQADNVSPATQALSAAAPPSMGVLAQPAATVARGSVATFSWTGGQPSAEVTPDEAFVSTQHWTGSAWETVFTDEGFEDLLDHRREGATDVWGTRWDVPLSAAAGKYRFAVTGTSYSDGALAPYTLTSDEFEVTASDGLSVTGARLATGGVLITASNPSPDRSVNFRLRAARPTTGSVTVTITHAGGGSDTASGTYDAGAGSYLVTVTAAAGDTVSVAAGGLTDGYANTNGTAFTAAL